MPFTLFNIDRGLGSWNYGIASLHAGCSAMFPVGFDIRLWKFWEDMTGAISWMVSAWGWKLSIYWHELSTQSPFIGLRNRYLRSSLLGSDTTHFLPNTSGTSCKPCPLNKEDGLRYARLGLNRKFSILILMFCSALNMFKLQLTLYWLYLLLRFRDLNRIRF